MPHRKCERYKALKIKEVSVNIKELRLSTGMTIQEFSDYFNIPRRTIENWEGGQRKPPVYVVELIKYKIKKEEMEMKNLKWCLIDGNATNEDVYVYDSKDEALENAEYRWKHMTDHDRKRTTTFAVVLLNIDGEDYAEIDGEIDADWYEVAKEYK